MAGLTRHLDFIFHKKRGPYVFYGFGQESL